MLIYILRFSTKIQNFLKLLLQDLQPLKKSVLNHRLLSILVPFYFILVLQHFCLLFTTSISYSALQFSSKPKPFVIGHKICWPITLMPHHGSIKSKKNTLHFYYFITDKRGSIPTGCASNRTVWVRPNRLRTAISRFESRMLK